MNIQTWAFLLKIQIFLLNRDFIFQEYTAKNPIFVFFNLLDQFSDHFLSASASCNFLTVFGYLFNFFCGDPKMGYNNNFS